MIINLTYRATISPAALPTAPFESGDAMATNANAPWRNMIC